jgi:hypothetical protein
VAVHGRCRKERQLGRSTTLWIAALAATIAAAAWQRRSGPSYPHRTQIPLADAVVPLTLPRSHPTTSAAPVVVPARGGVEGGTLLWRRYPTTEPFAAVPLRRRGGTLEADLPAQPPAGKVEYYLELTAGAERVRVPAGAGETVTLRFVGPVPAIVLIPHIAVMFLAMLLGARAGLAAAFESGRHGSLALATLAALTLGGLILGPITQKYAFGAYWTGVPFGWDFTDNKSLVAWVGWVVAAIAVLQRRHAARWLVALAALVMMAAYAVPHSLRGSQLDYTRAVRVGPR